MESFGESVRESVARRTAEVVVETWLKLFVLLLAARGPLPTGFAKHFK